MVEVPTMEQFVELTAEMLKLQAEIIKLKSDLAICLKDIDSAAKTLMQELEELIP